MYTLRSELIIRREFFGGIAIIINNGEFELDDFTTEFLLLFEETNDELQILEILNQNFNLKLSKSDIHEFIKQAKLFLIATDNTYSCENTIALANKMKMKRNNIKLINYLSAPLNVSIYPGMKCNLACDFCFISEEKWAYNNIMFSLDEWKPVLDQIKEMKIPYLTILGGEPLLYRGIWEMLDYLDEIGQQTHITTNGTIYSKKIIQQLKKYPKLTLKVSIQALDDRHKLLTKGSLDRTLKFIKTVKKEGIRCGIHTLGLKETVDQIPNIAQFANDLGMYE
ncbi:radical SAM peptide maturase, mycofactocin system [Mycobacteroides abscessus subsp. abscessus]|nr:radical SAM peptide maturase, mycofactocin system [Mycobacteroides abscessus subsp. abscessus]